MLNAEFLGGVSFETLGAMLVSSIFLAEFALSESPARRVLAKTRASGEGAAGDVRLSRAAIRSSVADEERR
jgi:hypothetical protein